MAIQRMNLTNFLQDADLRDRYVAAVIKIKTDGIYQVFVDWHGDGAVGGVAHDNVAFLAWHRIYVRVFEIELQKADLALQTAANAGFDANDVISVPWWDYPNMDSEDPSDERGRMWRDEFLGPSGSGADNEVASGPFRANHQFPIQERTSALSAPPAHTPGSPANLTRVIGRAGTRLASQDEIDHTVNRIDTFDNGAFTWPGATVPGSSDSNSFRAVLEGFAETTAVKRKNESGMHNGVHVWVGGKMADVPTAPNDPAFWLHHSNIDRLWAQWQARFPGDAAKQWPSVADITTARTTGVSGLVNPNAKQLSDPQTPWETAGRQWTAPGGAVLMTTEIYTAGDVLNWTAMGAGLGSYEYSNVNGRSISF